MTASSSFLPSFVAPISIPPCQDESLLQSQIRRVGYSHWGFSPDGNRLYAAGSEGIKIYDATPLPEKP